MYTVGFYSMGETDAPVAPEKKPEVVLVEKETFGEKVLIGVTIATLSAVLGGVMTYLLVPKDSNK